MKCIKLRWGQKSQEKDIIWLYPHSLGQSTTHADYGLGKMSGNKLAGCPLEITADTSYSPDPETITESRGSYSQLGAVPSCEYEIFLGKHARHDVMDQVQIHIVRILANGNVCYIAKKDKYSYLISVHYWMAFTLITVLQDPVSLHYRIHSVMRRPHACVSHADNWLYIKIPGLCITE